MWAGTPQAPQAAPPATTNVQPHLQPGPQPHPEGDRGGRPVLRVRRHHTEREDKVAADVPGLLSRRDGVANHAERAGVASQRQQQHGGVPAEDVHKHVLLMGKTALQRRAHKVHRGSHYAAMHGQHQGHVWPRRVRVAQRSPGRRRAPADAHLRVGAGPGFWNKTGQRRIGCEQRDESCGSGHSQVFRASRVVDFFSHGQGVCVCVCVMMTPSRYHQPMARATTHPTLHALRTARGSVVITTIEQPMHVVRCARVALLTRTARTDPRRPSTYRRRRRGS